MKIRRSPCKTCEKDSYCTNKKCIYLQDWVHEVWPKIKKLYGQSEKEKSALTALTAKAVEQNQETPSISIITKERGDCQDVQMP